MALEQWTLPRLNQLLPIGEGELHQLFEYTETLSDSEAATHLTDLLGDSAQAAQFISEFVERRQDMASQDAKSAAGGKSDGFGEKTIPPMSSSKAAMANDGVRDPFGAGQSSDAQRNGGSPGGDLPPAYAPPPGLPPTKRRTPHSNQVIVAANERSIDEVSLATGSFIFRCVSANPLPATNAANATEPPIPIPHLQQRYRARA